MQLHIAATAEELGTIAADKAAEVINRCIGEQGSARIILSAGASQFTFMEAMAHKPIDWSKVEMFHLDEYVGLPETHPASFRKYLRERFLSYAKVKKAHLVSGEGDILRHIAVLTEEINRCPIDLALIGLGENGHIAFNDPPADFDSTAAYKVVELDDACKQQQVGEGWFASIDDVPAHAITMTVSKILASRTIISCVPHAVKANAIKHTLNDEITPEVPATILTTHADWWLYVDTGSASLMNT